MTSPTSPTSVGQVSVEIVASAKGLAKSIRNEIKNAFKDLDLKSQLRDAISKGAGGKPIKLPVDADTAGIPEKIKRTRAPKVPVELDPLMSAFQSEVRRQISALAKTANAKIPVGADTTGVRRDIGAALAVAQRQLKAQIPTEAAGKAEYAAKLRALVDEASARVKAHVKVDVDSKGASGLSSITRTLQAATPNLAGFSTAIQGAVSGVVSLVGAAAPAGSALAGVAAAAGPIGALAAAIVVAAGATVGLAAAATLAGPALLAAAGAAAAIPAALSGLGAVVGTLSLGLKGISEAFKPKAGGVGGAAGQAANQARQVAAASRQVEAARRGITSANRGLESAERSLSRAEADYAKAQDRSRLATVAVSLARKAAVDDIDDLNRSLRSSKLSEEEAAQAIHDALLALNEAKLTGDIPSIDRADQAYRRALITLEDTKDASEDLQKQVDKTNKQGVDGTDRVQKALQDQASATDDVARSQESVRSAQDSLASAQDSLKSATDGLASAQEGLAAAQQKVATGGAAAAAKLIKLAPNAQKFVDAIKAMKPAFEDLRLDVQNRLFASLDKTVTSMWAAWKDQLHVTLGSFADTINGFLRDLGSAVSTPKFINDIAVSAAGARSGLAAIGKAITESLVPAFGTLSNAAGPFLKTVGAVISVLIQKFGTWVQQAKDSGALQDFFSRASRAFISISTTGLLVSKIIGDIFNILTGADPASGKTALDSFNTGLAKVHEFLSDPKNQKDLKTFVADLKDSLIQFGKLAQEISGWLASIGGEEKGKADSAGSTIGRAIAAGIFAGVKLGMTDGLKTWMKYSPLGQFITWVKNLFGIHSPSTVFAEIGRQLIAGLFQGAGNVNSLAGIPGRIFNAITGGLRNAGSWLYSHGRNVVIGLYNGIVSLGGWLWNAVTSFVKNNVRNAFASALHLGSPSKMTFKFGQFVSQGLALGILDEAGKVKAAAAELSTLAMPDVSLGALDANATSVAASLQASSSQQVALSWKQSATGDQVLDAIAGLIDLRHNGNVQAAFSRT